jgi:hypothetical protein
MFACTSIQSSILRFDLSPYLKVTVLHYRIDTQAWSKWLWVVTFCVAESAVWQFAVDAIHPGEINILLYPKCKTLAYSKPVCLLVLESNYLYGVVLGPQF